MTLTGPRGLAPTPASHWSMSETRINTPKWSKKPPRNFGSFVRNKSGAAWTNLKQSVCLSSIIVCNNGSVNIVSLKEQDQKVWVMQNTSNIATNCCCCCSAWAVTSSLYPIVSCYSPDVQEWHVNYVTLHPNKWSPSRLVSVMRSLVSVSQSLVTSSFTVLRHSQFYTSVVTL